MPATSQLPQDNERIHTMWELLGRNVSQTALQYGVTETCIRRRLKARYDIVQREYIPLKVSDARLYEDWVKLGCVRGAMQAVAFRHGAKYDAVRQAIRRHRTLVEAQFN